ncbi:MAG: hypothetical protein IKR09_09005 [Alphaproteobacteria bacterium]|nr:hypothetical protein [Alphaproteobacteria bacterium]
MIWQKAGLKNPAFLNCPFGATGRRGKTFSGQGASRVEEINIVFATAKQKQV